MGKPNTYDKWQFAGSEQHPVHATKTADGWDTSGHMLGYTDLGSNGIPGIITDATLDTGERLLPSPVRTAKRTAKPVQERQALVFDEKSGDFLDSSKKSRRAKIDWTGVQFEPAWAGTGKSQGKEKKDWILEL